MPREVRPLNCGWLFALTNQQTAPEDTAYAPVHLPHDWCILGQVDEHAPLGESQAFMHREQIGWYRLALQMDRLAPGHVYALDFGGVFENVTVWVNGIEVGRNGFGPTPFRRDVTQALHVGENDVLLRADCTRVPADRWYSGCGIYREVKLLAYEEKHLDERQVTVVTRLEGGEATVSVMTGVDAPVKATLVSPEGESTTAHGATDIVLHLEKPRLWTAENPNLYTLTLQLMDGERVADEISLHIGVREISFIPHQGMFVNGEHVYMRGVCLHHDLGSLGIAVSKELWHERLEALKEMGCNSLRLSHHIHSEEMMDLCDEMGFYVYEECFDKWHSGAYNRYFPTDWQKDVAGMLQRDRNRPSVVIWGVGNEVENQAHDSMIETLTMLVDYVHRMEPTRPVTYAMNPHFKRPANIDLSTVKDIQAFVDEVDDREIENLDEKLQYIRRIAEVVDIISCNYQEQWYPQIHAMMPDKLILGTEIYQYFVGDVDHYHNYTELPPPLINESQPWLVGGLIWSGYDYLGESMGWPSKGWTGAMLRTNGSRRSGYYMLKSFWTKDPMLHFSVVDYTMGDEFTKEHWGFPPCESHWDFPMFHKQVLPYIIATNCERVEIDVPGKSFVAPKKGENGLICGYLPYFPGEITLRGYQNGEVVCTQTLVTPGPAAQLAFEEHAALPAQEGYKALFTLHVQDALHNPVLREDRSVFFQVEGPGEIVTTDNGDLMDPTPYPSHERALWHGQCSVIVRLNGNPGQLRLKACAQGLEDAVLTVAVG